MFEFIISDDPELFELVLPISYVDNSQQSEITLDYRLVMNPNGASSTVFSDNFPTPDKSSGTTTFNESVNLSPGTYKFSLSMTATGFQPNDRQTPVSMEIIPEPSSSLLLLVGCLGLATRRTR